MNTAFYRSLHRALLAGKTVTVESALSPAQLGREYWHSTDGSAGGAPVEGERFQQCLNAPPHLVICGGGHVARALTPCAQSIGFRVTVIDDRQQELLPQYFPKNTELLCGDFEEVLRTQTFEPNAFFAVMTYGHRSDHRCISAILKLPSAYVGMLGSRSKRAMISASLLDEGFSQEQVDGIHTPIGLDIGSDTPAEIAISIAAELVQCRSGMGLPAPLDPVILHALDDMPYARVVVTGSWGSTPRKPGAWMLVHPDGSAVGTIGGGAGENKARNDALDCLRTGQPALHEYRLSQTSGSACGGSFQYLIIPVREDDGAC